MFGFALMVVIALYTMATVVKGILTDRHADPLRGFGHAMLVMVVSSALIVLVDRA